MKFSKFHIAFLEGQEILNVLFQTYIFSMAKIVIKKVDELGKISNALNSLK